MTVSVPSGVGGTVVVRETTTTFVFLAMEDENVEVSRPVEVASDGAISVSTIVGRMVTVVPASVVSVSRMVLRVPSGNKVRVC